MIFFALFARLRSTGSLRLLRRAYGAERQRLDGHYLARAVAQARYGVVCREIERRERRARSGGWPWRNMKLWS